jgi:hypothetical protein
MKSKGINFFIRQLDNGMVLVRNNVSKTSMILKADDVGKHIISALERPKQGNEEESDE